jgi:subtilisin-like proprotein convertase family protein
MNMFRSTGQPIPIPDKTGATMACVTAHMTIPSGTMRDTNIRIDVEHPAPADLNIYLDAPHSIYRNKPVTIVLTTDNDNGTQFKGTTFDSEATKKISRGLGARPLEGRFHAEGSFDQNLRGAESGGDWQLRVCDDGANGITGVLNWWEVEIVYPTSASDGSDNLIGGTGVHNLLDYAARLSPLNVSIDGLAGDGQTGENDNAGADYNLTLKTGMEDLYAGMANDGLNGNDFANDMRGHSGNDDINGFGGNDRFRGGEGDDTVDAGGGDDPAINGNNGDDVLFGRNGNDRLDGGAGIDYLDGGGGTDTCLNAGAGEVRINCE